MNTGEPTPPAMTLGYSTSAEAAAERLAQRTAEYAARLYRPRPTRALLGDDHPVDGEVCGSLVHPDDAAALAAAERIAAEDRDRWAAHVQRAQCAQQLVADPVTGAPLDYLRSSNR